jgi:hypothetical protein
MIINHLRLKLNPYIQANPASMVKFPGALGFDVEELPGHIA